MKKIIIFIITLVIILNPLKVSAFSNNYFYNVNDIIYFDSEYINNTSFCISNSSNSYSNESGDNQKTTAEFFASNNFAGNGNKPLNAVQIAAIMGNIQQESGFNPDAVSGTGTFKGIVQWGPGRWDLISKPKNTLINQLNHIKTELDRSDYINNLGNFWNIIDPVDIDEATFLITRNYEIAITDGGGSKEWTGDSDATKYLQGWSNRRDYAHDMLSKYGNIIGYTACIGMNEAGAIAYMQAYENSDGTKLINAYDQCDGYNLNPKYKNETILANCVAVVKYFLQNNTTFEIPSVGNGGEVVQNLIKYGFIDGGNTPKPYAIFSTAGSGSAGHTGLVLGVTDTDTIIFEEGCGNKLYKDGDDWAGVKKIPITTANSSYTFAYPPEGSLVNL